MAPAIETTTAVARAAVPISTTRARRTSIPSAAALSAPKVKASSVRTCHSATPRPSSATGSASRMSGQRTPERLPRSQNMIPRACSALADCAMISAVAALNICDPAMPARMMMPVVWTPVPRAARARIATRPKATSAPAKAPADMLITPAPKPATATATAPVEAPAEIPSR